MADDQEQVVNQENTDTPSDATADKTTSEEVPAEEPKAESIDLTPEEKSSLSEKAQKRMQYLANQAKEVKANADVEKPVEESSSTPEKFLEGIPPTEAVSQTSGEPSGLPWDQSEPKDISFQEYERDVTQKADAIASARVAQTEQRLRKEAEIRDDYKTVVDKWDELDPENSSYNEDLSDKLAGIYEKQLRADPKAKLADFVNSIMEVRQGGKEKGKEEVTNKLVEQKAEAAVTPSPETELAQQDPTGIFKDPKKVKEQEAYLKEHGMWD